jgi:hypothetical protein
MLSNANINKLEKIAKAKNSSVAEIVRTAVESYNPVWRLYKHGQARGDCVDQT